jgi:hypothetical protein
VERTDLLGETRVELVDRARRLGLAGYSRMTKQQLIDAITRTLQRDNTARRKLGQPG